LPILTYYDAVFFNSNVFSSTNSIVYFSLFGDLRRVQFSTTFPSNATLSVSENEIQTESVEWRPTVELATLRGL